MLFLYGELLLTAALMAACGIGSSLVLVNFGPYTAPGADWEVAQTGSQTQTGLNGTNSSAGVASCSTDMYGMVGDAVGGRLYVDLGRYYMTSIIPWLYTMMGAVVSASTLVSRGAGHGQWRRAIKGCE